MRLTLLIAAFVLVLIGSFLIAGDAIDSLVGMDASFAEGLEHLRGMGPWAAAAIAGLLVADVLLPVPATPLFTALGALYGTLVGGAIGASASIVAGLSAYGLTRVLGDRGARWLLGERDLARLRRFLDRAGTPTVIASRWLPILPETVACLAGLASMPLGRFLPALAIGTVPMTFAFAAIGAGLADRPATAFAVALAISALLWPAAVWVRRAAGDRR